MKNIIISFFIIVLAFQLNAQSEEDKIRIPLNDYIVGTSYNYPDQIVQAFSDSAKLYLNRGNGEEMILTPADYARPFGRNKAGVFNGRTSKIVSIQQYQNIASAEIEVLIPKIDARFIDVILLKKYGDDWKIISKTATRFPLIKKYKGPQQKLIMSGLKKPWSMDFINANEAIVAEKDGDLLWVNLKSKSKKVIQGFPKDLFTDLELDVSKYPKGTYPERADGQIVRFNAGILEVLLDPEFKDNNYIYVSYISQKGDTYALKVIRAKLQNHKLSEIKTLLNPGPYVPGLFHFGGGMLFGKDGKLYITAGERLFFEYLKEGLAIAQDLKDERGKIYRINPDGSIPEDNPDFGPDAPKGIYALGIRAAQGLALHPQTGKIWFSEHGTIQGDEINILEKGANYGWPNVTSGKYRSPGYKPAEIPGAQFKDPVHYWLQTVAPTGLVFYNGYKFQDWYGDLIVPGLSRGSLWRISLEGEKVKAVEELFMDKHVRLRKAEMGPDGRLYILTSEENGKIIEIVKSK